MTRSRFAQIALAGLTAWSCGHAAEALAKPGMLMDPAIFRLRGVDLGRQAGSGFEVWPRSPELPGPVLELKPLDLKGRKRRHLPPPAGSVRAAAPAAMAWPSRLAYQTLIVVWPLLGSGSHAGRP